MAYCISCRAGWALPHGSDCPRTNPKFPDESVNALAQELDKSPAEIRRALANLKERRMVVSNV